MRILPRLFFVLFAGTCFRVSAKDFAEKTSAESLLYLEIRDVPAFRQRLREIPALEVLAEFDWNTLTLQLFEIGLLNVEDPDPEEEDITTEDMETALDALEQTWEELVSHLDGDIAFSMGNFTDVVGVFRENALVRANLREIAFEEGLEGDEELTEEQMEELSRRLSMESRLDAMEFASILDQFHIWIDVKEEKELEEKLVTWAEEFLSDESEDSESEIQLTKTPVNGTTFYSLRADDDILNPPSLNWAIHDGIWMITFTPDSLDEALEILANPPVKSLANHQAYQEAVTYVGPADYVMYLNFAPLDDLIREMMAGIPEESTQNYSFLGQFPTAEAVLEWLDLKGMLPYVLGSRWEMEGILTRGRLGFRRESALSRIVIDPTEETIEVPAFLNKNVGQFASFIWDLGNGWTRMETELMGLAPQAAAALGLGRMLVSGQVGFDLKLQLLDHLNGKMVLVQSIDPEVIKKIMNASDQNNPAGVMQVQMEHPTGGQNYLFALGMEDEAAVREAFNRLMTRFNPLGNPEPVMVENHEVYYPIPEEFQSGRYHRLVTYAFLDDYLLIAFGDDTLLSDAIRASQDPALQLAHQPDFQDLRAKLPPNPISMEYSNADQQKKGMELLQASLSMFQSQHPDVELPDFTALAEIMKQTLAVSIRKGLVFEVESRIEFSPVQ